MRRDEDARPANSIKTQPSVINPVKYAGFTSCWRATIQFVGRSFIYYSTCFTASLARTLTVAAEWACGVIIKCKEQKGLGCMCESEPSHCPPPDQMYLRSLTGASQTTSNSGVRWRRERRVICPFCPLRKGHCASLRGEKRLYVFNYHTPLRPGTPINYQTSFYQWDSAT
jgi:hypothetical protein